MKDKIVGNILAICTIFFASLALSVDIKLRLTTMDGASLSQAGAGEPFLLEAAIPDTDSTHAPTIAGLDKFYVRNAGIQIRSINGRSSVKHLYKIRIDVPGEYVLGPATLSVGGENLQSNMLDLIVGERQQTTQVPTKRRKQTSQAFLILKLNKKEAFVGEKIKASLQFFFVDSSISLEQLFEPELSGIVIGSKRGPRTDIRTIDGTEYHVVEWIFELYPKQDGELTIPAYSADFLVQQQERFAGFSLFFGQRAVRKRIYSNAARIHIMPLPSYDVAVDAIGVFSGFNTKIDPPVAKEGEGMVLSLILEGEGNFDAIKAPELHDMPTSFKYYDSKSYCSEDVGSGKHAKYFEYIIQGLDEGDWEIPAQHIVYFDTKRKAYKTLKTAPLHVTILAQNVSKHFNISKQVQQNSQDKSSDEMRDSDTLLPLNKNGEWYSSDKRQLSWYLFFLFLILPLVYLLIYCIKRVLAYINLLYGPPLRQKRSFVYARKQVKAAMAAHDTALLYQLFIDLCAVRLQVSSSLFSQEYIKQKLQEAGWATERLKEWDDFFTKLAEHAYSSSNQSREHELFEQSLMWLTLLEKVI